VLRNLSAVIKKHVKDSLNPRIIL